MLRCARSSSLHFRARSRLRPCAGGRIRPRSAPSFARRAAIAGLRSPPRRPLRRPRRGDAMEMQQVRYFVALARELNFTRAAEACNVSQPALTRAIQGLEAELGGPLFHRDKMQTQISELGRMMLPHIQDMLAQTEAAREQAKKFKQIGNSELKLGAMC